MLRSRTLAALVAAAVVAVPTLVLAPGTGGAAPTTATPIKHLVVIFQENVSFDHYFATYPNAAGGSGQPFTAAAGTPSVNGLSGALLTANPNGVNPRRLNPSNVADLITCDQDHGYTDEQKAFDNGKMDKFPQSVGNGSSNLPTAPAQKCSAGDVMNYYDGNTVTGLWNYAQHFAMSDNSFGTTFGPSTPGALNLIAGQTDGVGATAGAAASDLVSDGVGGQAVINDAQPLYDDCDNREAVALTGKNVGDELNSAGLTWGWFQGGFAPTTPYAGAGTKAACNATHNVGAALGGTGNAGAQPYGTKSDYIPHHEPFQYYASTANPHHLPPSSVAAIGTTDQANHQYDLSDFDALLNAIADHTVSSDHLPAVTYLKAPGYQDGHAGYSDPIDEQRFVSSEINKLEQLPTWSSTAVVVSYDDSDGFYDHVYSGIHNPSVTTADALTGTGQCGATSGSLGGEQGRCGYGPRLPLLVISPFAKANFVDHSLSDQSSILRFIEDNWSLPRLAGSFDASAGPLNTLFNFSGTPSAPVFEDPATGLVTSSPTPTLPTSVNEPGGVFAIPPGAQTLPDDLTSLNGHVYTTFQNGVAADGTAAKNGTSTSTIVEYDLTGHATQSWTLTGRCDGLTADPANNRLIATVNEDANSYLATITPSAPTATAIQRYTYSPSPSDASGGGTDSVAIDGGHVYVAHSNPSNTTVPAVYEVTLSGTTATLTPVFADNATATNALTNASAPLALTDPDSNTIVPAGAPRYGGQLLQDSQADGQVVFDNGAASHHPSLTVLPLSNGTATQPTVDDVTFATADRGTLFVVDQAAGTISALSTAGFPAGTAFVAQPSDSGNPGSVGTLDLATGRITPLANRFRSPKGLLFLPIALPPVTTPNLGYLSVNGSGAVSTFGNAPVDGSAPAQLAAPIVGMAATPSGNGYWLVASDGGVFTFGDATFHGSTGGMRLNAGIVGMAATPSGNGYWLVASDGGVFTFGDATFHGSTGGMRLNAGIVGMAATPSGNGYWLVASDGGVFTFGDATFHGSTGGMRLNAGIVGMAATPSGNGYWLVASDGGVFTFGDATFHGSTGGMRLNAGIVGMAATPSGNGYWLVASDGGVFTYGDAVFRGSASGSTAGTGTVGMAA